MCIIGLLLRAVELSRFGYAPARSVATAEAVRLGGGLGAHHLADDPDAPQGPSQFDTIATQLRPSPTEDSLRSRGVCSH